MSNRAEQGSARRVESGSVLDILYRWYHVPVLVVLMVFMFLTRFASYERFVREDGRIALAAVDSWYHWRTTMYTVQNWPNTMPFDPWTGFPSGRYVGQFGTAFDQLVATIAMIVGLGDPSEQTVYLVVLVAIPAMGALVAIPTYYLGKRLGGRIGGLGSVFLLALFPGTFFFRSTVGQHQHHVAEVLFMAIAVLAMMVALAVAEREKPVYELVVEHEFAALRRPLGYSALAGIAIAVYVWMWPPGMVLIGILGVFFVIKLSADYVRGESPEHVAFVGIVGLTVAGILSLFQIEQFTTSSTSFGYMQPVLAFLVAGGCLFMAWLAREWDARSIDKVYYPVAIAVSIGLSMIVLAVVLPDVFGRLTSELFGRLTPIGTPDHWLTIAEAQPPSSISAHAFQEYGLAFYTALIALCAIAAKPFFGGKHRAEFLLLVVWSLFILSMSITQVRFNYYLAVVVAVLNAYLIAWVVDWADVPEMLRKISSADGLDGIKQIEGYQVMVLLTVVMILVVPLMPPVAGATVVDRGAAMGPSPDAVKWEPANDWLAANSPEPGAWGGANSSLDYYGTFDQPPGGSFDYPEGSYGVISWWDYGHLISVQAERIPHSNPFQQNARSSSAFLISQSETMANLILDAIAAGESPRDHSEDELREMVGDGDHDEQIRYVMIDDSMAAGKFPAIATWTGPGYEAHVDFETVDLGDNETATLPVRGERYENTTLSRLYFDDASSMETYRLVHETERQTIIGSLAQRDAEGTWHAIQVNQELSFDLMIAAQQHPDFAVYDLRQASAVKTFERVEGAELVGQTDAPAGTTVTAHLELTAETTNRTFGYVQETTVDDDGAFSLTVPYATSNDLGPDDGYTDTSVLAEGPYTIYVGEDVADEIGIVDVPEVAIYDGETIEVVLEPTDADEEIPDEDELEDEELETDQSESDGTENGDGETTSDGNESEDDAGNESENDGGNESENDDETPSITVGSAVGGR